VTASSQEWAGALQFMGYMFVAGLVLYPFIWLAADWFSNRLPSHWDDPVGPVDSSVDPNPVSDTPEEGFADET